MILVFVVVVLIALPILYTMFSTFFIVYNGYEARYITTAAPPTLRGKE